MLRELLARPIDPDVKLLLLDVRKVKNLRRTCFLSNFPDEDRARHFAVAAIAQGHLTIADDGDEIRLTGLGQAKLDYERRMGR